MKNQILKKDLRLNDKKNYFKLLDRWASNLLDEGLIFFGVTINLAWFYMDKTHNNFFQNLDEARSWFKNRFLAELASIDFIECIQGSLELGDRNILHLHAVLAFRFHFNCVPFIRKRLEALFCFLELTDYKLSSLNKFKDVVKQLRYFSKDFNKERNFGYHFFSVYSNFFKETHEIIISKLIDEEIEYFEGKTLFDLFEDFYGKFSDLLPITGRLKSKEAFEVVFYLGFYLQKQNFLIYKNNIYKKIENSELSYKLVLPFEEFVKNNAIFILSNIKKEVFDFIKIAELYGIFIENPKKVIDQLLLMLSNNVKELNFNLLEFKDGIYVASSDVFLTREKYKSFFPLEKKYFTIRHFDVTFDHVAYRNTFFLWKKKLKINLSEEEFIKFCIQFRNVLFPFIESTKKNIIFLLGETNSGKSRLVLDLAIESYGQQNVGSLSTDSKFLVENLLYKELALIDEPELSKSSLGIIKKMGSGEMLTINAKYEKAVYEQLTTRIIVASNINKTSNLLLNNDAIMSRVFLVLFNKQCLLTNEEHKEVLNELPRILVYCNKLFFKEKKDFIKNDLLKEIKGLLADKNK